MAKAVLVAADTPIRLKKPSHPNGLPYPDAPHGMPMTISNVINNDLMAFIDS